MSLLNLLRSDHAGLPHLGPTSVLSRSEVHLYARAALFFVATSVAKTEVFREDSIFDVVRQLSLQQRVNLRHEQLHLVSDPDLDLIRRLH